MEPSNEKHDAVYKGVFFRFIDTGEAVVSGCLGDLEEVVIPRSVRKHPVTAISDCAFWGHDSIRSVVIRADLEYIGDWAFFDCSGLTDVSIPHGTAHIGCGAFRGCSSLLGIIVPETVNYIGYSAFAECSSLRTAVLPAGMLFTPSSLFSGCISLTDTELPASLVTLGDRTFANCTSIDHVILPEGITTLGKGSFEGCTSLSCLMVPRSVTEIGENAFTGCESLNALGFAPGIKVLNFGGYYSEADASEKNIGGGVYRYTGDVDGFEYVCTTDELPSLVLDKAAPLRHGTGRFKPVGTTGVTFDDIAGLEEAKEEIRRQVVYPFTHADAYAYYKKKSGGGVLLYGPTGSGKTMLAQAVASEIKAAFFSVKSSDIVSKFDGEGEERLKDLFETARSYPVSVIFFDEFESIGKSRGNSLQPWRDDTMSELLAQMQGFEKSDCTLMVMAATNRPWDLDHSLLRPGRFGTRIYVPLPDTASRLKIIESAFKDVPHGGFDSKELATSLSSFSGADVAEFTEQMKMSAILRSIETGIKAPVCKDDVIAARRKVKSSVKQADLERFELFNGPIRWTSE